MLITLVKLALVFKCASDTIFLDDFKKVLDSIVARTLDRARGTVRKGAPGGLPQRRPPAIERPSRKVEYGSVSTIYAEHSLPSTRGKWGLKLFGKHDKAKGSHVSQNQHENAITETDSRPNNNSQRSFGSGAVILKKVDISCKQSK